MGLWLDPRQQRLKTRLHKARERATEELWAEQLSAFPWDLEMPKFQPGEVESPHYTA